MLLMALFACAAPASAADHILNPGDSIKQNITDAADGDTIILNPGTYYQNSITFNKNITIRAADGHGPSDTIIDAQQNYNIFAGSAIGGSLGYSIAIHNLTLQNVSGPSSGGYGGGAIASAGTVNITNSAIINCSTQYGGAIKSDDSIYVTNSVIINCSATGGPGGALVAGGSVTVVSSTFTNCSAPGGFGGAIYASSGIVNVTSSTFTSCSTGSGGAIYTANGVTVTSSTFTGCSATNRGGAVYAQSITSSTFTGCFAARNGGAVYGTVGTISIHFSRLYGNTAPTGPAVCRGGIIGTVNVTHNWWGSNADPSAYLSGTMTYDPWLVLGVTATPSAITTGQTSVARANLTFDSTGADRSGSGLVPDGIPVVFTRTSGTGSVAPVYRNLTAGANTTTFTATVDGESAGAAITVAAVPVTTATTAATGGGTADSGSEDAGGTARTRHRRPAPVPVSP